LGYVSNPKNSESERIMPVYNAFRAIGLSFYSKSLYRDVVRYWGGRGFRYLVIVVGTCVLLQTALLAVMLSTMDAKTVVSYIDSHIESRARAQGTAVTRAFVEKELSRLFAVMAQIPPLTLQRGELHVEGTLPFVIKDPDNNNPLAVFVREAKDPPLAPIEFFPEYIVFHGASPNQEHTIRFSEGEKLGRLDEEQFNAALEMISSFPPLSIKGDLLTMDVPSPYVIGREVQPLMIIDTTTTGISDANATLLLTKDTLTLRKKKGTYSWKYADIDRSTIEKAAEEAAKYLRREGYSALMKLVPFKIAINWAMLVLAAALFGVVARTLGAYKHVRAVTFDEYIRLAAVALTPMIIGKFFIPALPFATVFYCCLVLGYIYLAVSAQKELD